MNAKGGAVATLAKVAGDDQAALVNQAVGTQLKVRVLDSFGNPVQDAAVTWTASGDGIATPTVPKTDVNGEVTATWKLGSTPGTQTLQVAANGKSVGFNATATIQYTSVDAGGFDGCGITPSAQAFCWGFNGDGQLGINSTTNRNVPTAVATVLTFRQLSGGRYHTCGITLSGIAYCWGSNPDGRLGTNSTTPSLVPVQTATPVTFDSVSSGLIHSCALSRSGLVYCWGFNQEGEVGARVPPPDSIVVKVPRPVSSQAFRSVSTGGMHACALDRNNGTAWCWGFNSSGQLGDGTTGFGTLNNTVVGADTVSLPVAVAGGRSWKSISSGYRHTCALATDGTAWCWGEGTQGQLGNGGTGNVSVPTMVTMPASVTFTDISAGAEHTCAVAASTGAVYCWGSNGSGQLGNTSASAYQLTPIQVSSTLAFTSVSAGEVLTCGITNAKAVYCWGANDYGQLGDGTVTDHLTPAPVAGP
jgi:alpha-tubulin suppressor-like RCC1 family protein